MILGPNVSWNSIHRIPIIIETPQPKENTLIDLFILLNATFSIISAISWRPVLVVEEGGVL